MKRDKKLKVIYALMVTLVLTFVFVIVSTYLFLNYDIIGTGKVINSYYDVLFQNVTMDYDTTTNVTLENDSNSIYININDLNNYEKTNSISLDVTNIGNIDARITNYYITNIESNIDSDNVIIKLSLNEDTIIHGSETKKLNIDILYKNKVENTEAYIKFRIKYYFDEVVL